MSTAMFVHEEDQPKAKRKKTGGRVKGSPFRKNPNDFISGQIHKDIIIAPVKEKRAYKKRKQLASIPAKPRKKSQQVEETTGLTFLFFTVGKDEFVEPVKQDLANERAEQIFMDPDYAGLQQIYFMKPLRLFTRPVMQIQEL